MHTRRLDHELCWPEHPGITRPEMLNTADGEAPSVVAQLVERRTRNSKAVSPYPIDGKSAFPSTHIPLNLYRNYCATVKKNTNKIPYTFHGLIVPWIHLFILKTQHGPYFLSCV